MVNGADRVDGPVWRNEAAITNSRVRWKRLLQEAFIRVPPAERHVSAVVCRRLRQLCRQLGRSWPRVLVLFVK